MEPSKPPSMQSTLWITPKETPAQNKLVLEVEPESDSFWNDNSYFGLDVFTDFFDPIQPVDVQWGTTNPGKSKWQMTEERRTYDAAQEYKSTHLPAWVSRDPHLDAAMRLASDVPMFPANIPAQFSEGLALLSEQPSVLSAEFVGPISILNLLPGRWKESRTESDLTSRGEYMEMIGWGFMGRQMLSQLPDLVYTISILEGGCNLLMVADSSVMLKSLSALFGAPLSVILRIDGRAFDYLDWGAVKMTAMASVENNKLVLKKSTTEEYSKKLRFHHEATWIHEVSQDGKILKVTQSNMFYSREFMGQKYENKYVMIYHKL
mmetsp:Transcript_23859/g.32805  ORF Transcript_23859/g.32805 Transcript_23859/m.32805 type:complete len:320 (-) Transcript_23859:161-1120(-)